MYISYFRGFFVSLGFACLILLTGCATSNIQVETPKDFRQQVVFKKIWDVGSSGTGKVQMNLNPNFVTYQDQKWVAIPDYKGRMTVVDATSGDLIWRTKTKIPFSSAAGETDDAIVVGSSKGQVVAFSKETGDVLWESQVSSEVLAAPRGNSQALVVLTIDSRLHGLDAKTGKEIWTYDATAPALTLRGASDPLIIEDMAFVGFSNGQVGLFKLTTGQMLWLEAAARPRGRNEIERMVDIDGTIARADNTVYLVTYHGNILAVDLNSLQVTWSSPMSSYVGLSVSGDNLVVSDADDNVYLIDRITGETRWKQTELADRYLTTPAIYEDYVIVTDISGYIFALSLQNGQLLGYERIFGNEMRAPVLTDSEGVIVQSGNGDVDKVTILKKQDNH